jgi:hypothetical protein
VYLANLRNTNSGRYEHHGLSTIYGEDSANSALRESHMETFRQWINYNIEEQKSDLDLYLSAQPTERKVLVESWIHLAAYRGFLPAAVEAHERQLFLADLESLLWLLRNETGAAAPIPGA